MFNNVYICFSLFLEIEYNKFIFIVSLWFLVFLIIVYFLGFVDFLLIVYFWVGNLSKVDEGGVEVGVLKWCIIVFEGSFMRGRDGGGMVDGE